MERERRERGERGERDASLLRDKKFLSTNDVDRQKIKKLILRLPLSRLCN